jgi:hypothetical protein
MAPRLEGEMGEREIQLASEGYEVSDRPDRRKPDGATKSGGHGEKVGMIRAANQT